MHRKIIPILAVIILIIIVGAVYIFLSGFSSQNSDTQKGPAYETVKNKLATDDFEITLADGWKGVPAATGISAVAVDTNENITDPAAQRINFKTYLAVSHDTLNGKNITEYMQTVKTSLLQTMPDTVFSNEHTLTINNRQVLAMEADIANQGADYKVLIVAVKGNGEDVWVMSFNTLKSSWQQYAQTFSDMANNFIVKQK